MGEDRLKEVLAALLMVPAGEITRETLLTTLNNSLGEARLRLTLKRCGTDLPPGSRPSTFGVLADLLLGVKAQPEEPPPAVSADPMRHLQIGLDVQDVASLPVCADYWEDEFYRGFFAPSEIAYAVLQPEPRTHLAGFWSAKEALRKCDPNFANVAPADTAVAHDPAGRPYLVWKTAAGPVRLRHAVSISHAANLAAAVVAAAPIEP